jgi:hypothetical protein
MTITKEKVKLGKVDKVVDSQNLHVRDLFSKETSPDIFVNLRVSVAGKMGTITGTFGKSGKLKVRLDSPHDLAEQQLLECEVELRYKKNMMKKKANKFK